MGSWYRLLYITDGSAMVTGAAINPTSTISALAYRAAHRLADNFVEARRATGPLLD